MYTLITSNEVQEQRLRICGKCPYQNKLKICSVCKCVVPAKVKIKDTRCPLGLWREDAS
jgi:hypothetical protein